MENLPGGTRPESSEAGHGFRFPLALLALTMVLCAVLVTHKLGWQGASPDLRKGGQMTMPSPPSAGPFVGLAIDFGNGTTYQFDALPWSEGMTVGDALDEVSRARPGVDFVEQGEGEGAFLVSIGGIGNSGGDPRHWLYRVDERDGEVSFRAELLQPGASVLWIFSAGE